MLTQKNRLKKRKDIENVFKKGKTIAGRLVFLKLLKNKLDFNRFALIVSLKISKKAVVRNKIRRQLRALIKDSLSDIKTGFDILIIAKPEIIDKNYQEIENDIEKIFQNL